MANKRSGRHAIIAALLRDFPQASNHTLAKRLHSEHPAQFPKLEPALQCVRYFRGGKGKRDRRYATIAPSERDSANRLPTAIPEEWTPFELDCRRCLILSDIHVLFQANRAITAALQYGDSFDPDAILINGDFFDFYQLSKFIKKPTLVSVGNELLAGGKLLDLISARFPKAKKVFKKGNHDERWDKYLYDVAALLSDIPGITEGWRVPGGIVRNNFEVVGDKRPIMLGKLPVLHGHELPIKSSVNPARAAWLKTNHTCLFGHFHQSTSYSPTDMFHDENATWSTGCLCQLSPQYMPINSWTWGFAAVEVHRDQSFDVHNMRIEKNGKVRAS